MKNNEYVKMKALEDSHFWFLGKRMFVKAYLQKAGISKNKKLNILDLGSGTGGMTAFLKNYGKILGVEKNPLAIKFAKERGLDILLKDINEIGFKENQFDLVTIFDVLYHKNIKSEIKVLSKVNRILKHGGYLLITDSALNILQSRHDIEVEGARRYTVDSMKTILNESRFQVVNASYIYFTIFPIVFIKRKILSKIFGEKESDVSSVNPIINRVLLNILRIEAFLLKFISFPIGSSVIILARKK